ncbi:Transient receptor potential cation channel subfamily M member 2 [Trichoplax sp. H2]|nr:Transient receptor potential cation channel subfamily M member 2 [Trichoplax sp. H2]|eukprot:RDD39507.1 Transient receptor potential cation channel subfamily M member 2 [Trichoplax sp. H2]
MKRLDRIEPSPGPSHGRQRSSSSRRRTSSTSTLNFIDTMAGKQIANAKVKHFIVRNFRKKECNKFIKGKNWKNDPSDIKRCSCGRVESWHGTEHMQESVLSEERWNSKFHTVPKPTDAYGEIDFFANCQQRMERAKFIRVKDDTDPTMILRLLQDYWGLRKPNLVISVTGGAQKFKLVPKIREVFRRGLMKAAQSTGAYIISGGSHSGVMKYVGQAVRDSSLIRSGEGGENLVAIGIATWGTVLGKHELVDAEGSFPVRYRSQFRSGEIGAPLDPNHTHFILVDDGTVGRFGAEIGLRSKLEQTISEQKMHTYKFVGNHGFRIPVVCVVLEGGPNTMATVHAAIEQNTPGVVVAGSGRAANILAYAYNHTYAVVEKNINNEEVENHYLIPEFEDEVVEKIYQEFNWTQEKNEVACMNCLRQVKQCLQKKSMLTIYHAEDGDLDAAILEALMKANPSSQKTQLNLALTWNKIDIARDRIFCGKKWKSKDLETAMMTALVDNRVDFVKLFIGHGLDLNEFLTKKRLEELYQSFPKFSLFNQLLNEYRRNHKNDQQICLYAVGKVIGNLIGGGFTNPYVFYEEEYNEQTVTGKDEADCDVQVYDSDSSDEDDDKRANREFEDPYQHIFIWAVLRNRPEMAFYLWQKLHNPIAAALVAYTLFDRMAASAENVSSSDVAADLSQTANEFEELSIGVMNECYNTNEENAMLLLTKILPRWGDTTCLALADNAHSEIFIAHRCCQALLNNLWNGDIEGDTASWIVTITTCLPVILLSTNYVRFRSNIDHKPKSIRLAAKPNPNEAQNPTDVELVAAELADQEISDSAEQQAQAVIVTRGSSSKGQLCNFKRIPAFYKSPRTKFTINSISFFSFIILYAYMILSDFRSPYPGAAEYILIVWTFSLFVEELRQLIRSEAETFSKKLASYLSDLWNIADVVALAFVITAIVLRFFEQTRETGRIIYCLGFIIYCLRVLQIYSVSIHFGPLLVMIKKMLSDLVFFVVILGVFLVAYGVSSHAILHPNYPFNATIIQKIFYIPYFNIYGELFLAEIQGQNCPPGQNYTTDPTNCVANNWLVPVLFSLYLLITNILLINLLIAMFNNTFSLVQERSDLVWKFQRYDLIREYLERPALPPPFILISHLNLVIKSLRKNCKSHRYPVEKNSLKVKMTSRRLDQQLELWEFEAADAYWLQAESKKSDSIESRVRNSGERLEHMAAIIAAKGVGSKDSRLRPVTAMPDENSSMERIERRLADLDERTMEMFDAILEHLDAKEGLSSDRKRRLSQFRSLPIPPPSVTTLKLTDSVPIENEVGRYGHSVHKKARKSPYPGTAIQRFPVPDNAVNWEIPFPDYEPVVHTDDVVLAGPIWADPDILTLGPHHPDSIKILYNCLDPAYNVNRVSYEGDYMVVDGFPLNPEGRTGVKGRGLLGRWGPNHAADPIVTRWKRNVRGIVIENDKKVLEFVAIQRRDNHQWAIPGGMVEPGETISQTLKAEFSEEALGKLEKTPEESEQIKKHMDQIFQDGHVVYKGYVDDPRNTDHAWMETIAVNFHDNDGSVFNNFELQAGDDACAVRWQRVSSKVPLFASHSNILKQVAKLHEADF